MKSLDCCDVYVGPLSVFMIHGTPIIIIADFKALAAFFPGN